ncbi:MAG: hypothetical protein PSV35_05570 [bacterium]|nr:hypothetical protein [bacterium]
MDGKPVNETYKKHFRFFNQHLSEINNQRISINRSKGLARYFASSQLNIRTLQPLDTSLGIMSFSLYLLRFVSNGVLLINMHLEKEQGIIQDITRSNLYYSLFNDFLWSIVNGTQFFWLSYRNSPAAGLHGMQLETVGQLIDLIAIIFRYDRDKKNHEKEYQNACPDQRQAMEIEWQNKEYNFIRTLITSVLIMGVFALFSFAVAIPFSPLLCIILVINSLLKLIMDLKKDRQLIMQLQNEGANQEKIKHEEQLKTLRRIADINQIIQNNIFLPLGLFVLLTASGPLAFGVCLSLVIIHYSSIYFINCFFAVKSENNLIIKLN